MIISINDDHEISRCSSEIRYNITSYSFKALATASSNGDASSSLNILKEEGEEEGETIFFKTYISTFRTPEECALWF